MPSRPSFDNHQRNPPNHHRGGFPDGGNHQRHQPHQPHQPFDSPPPNYPGGGGGRGGFRPMGPAPGGGGAGFRPMGGGGRGGGAPGFRPMMSGDNDGGAGGFGGGDGYPTPHAGQKRGYPFPPGPAQGTSPPDGADGGSFAKLFVGSVPKTATEEDIRPLFEEHGDVVEVALLKDKRTGQQQGCCFIKYATSEEADRAIGALHNKYTLPGGVGPIQVRYADGERERLGAVEHKLFVGCMNRQATVKEIEEIFTPYGRVEDVYIMRDEVKQSRGCGFVKYSHKDMATTAIAALSGKYVMRGCEQPLIVRFADPKRPRVGESRVGPALGGPGSGDTRPQALPGIRPPPYIGDPMGGHAPPNAWHPRSPQSGGPPSNANAHGFGSPLAARGGVAPVPSAMGGPLGAHGGAPMNGSHPGVSLPPSSFQQSSDPSQPQVTSAGQQVSPMQKPVQSPQHFLPPFQLHSQQMPGPYPQKETPPVPAQQTGQLQNHSSASQPSSTQSQTMPPQQLYGFSGQVPASQSQVQHSASPAAAQLPPPNFQRQGSSPSAGQQQSYQPLQQPPTQLAQALSQQTQALQASFQSSQQAFSQLQQQLHLIQQSNQNSSQHQASQSNQNSSQHQAPHGTRQQSPWTGMNAHTGASTPAAVLPAVTPSTSTAAAPVSMQTPAPAPTPAPLTCNWTEHTSPEGFKYYYNSVTQESKWEKPEELSLFEQQQHKQQQPPPQQQQQLSHSVQHQPPSQAQSHPHTMSSQPVSQTQQFQPQPQNYPQHQFQPQRALSSSDTGYPQPQLQPQPQPHLQPQPQPVANLGHDLARYQQAPQAAQEWMWKNNPTGGTSH